MISNNTNLNISELFDIWNGIDSPSPPIRKCSTGELMRSREQMFQERRVLNYERQAKKNTQTIQNIQK